MKRLTIAFCVILAISSCATNRASSDSTGNNGSGSSSDSDGSFFGPRATSMKDVFTPEFIETLQKADSVQISRIKTKAEAGLSFDPLVIEKTDMVKLLSEKEIEKLKAILLDASSYRFDTKNKCPFLPEYQIEFQFDSKVVGIFVSVNCGSLAANMKGSPIIDMSPQAASLLEMLK
jgi:hypothetical protein